MYDAEKIGLAVEKILAEYKRDQNGEIKVGVSQRHIHLSREDLDTLFGKGYELTKKKTLMGREYAAEECVTLVGPSLKSIEKVRVLGPVRKDTQVEISRTDTFILKVSPPVRPSGKIEGSERIVLVGPCGSVYLNEGVIIAKRHIHITPEDAEAAGVADKEIVSVKIDSEGRSLVFGDVVVRVSPKFAAAMHIDTDESNAAAAFGTVYGEIVK